MLVGAGFSAGARALGGVRVTRYFSGPFSDEEVRVRLEREIERMKAHNFQYWPMFTLGDDEHFGCCGLRPYGTDCRIPELDSICDRSTGEKD